MVSYELAESFGLARRGTEVRAVDVGKDAAREYLGPGWSYDERTGGDLDFAWSVGPSSTLLLPVASPAAAALRLALSPLPLDGDARQELAVRVNGEPLATLTLDQGLATYELPIPPGALRAGVNRIELLPSPTLRALPRSRRERRDLGIALDRVELVEPAGETADGAASAPAGPGATPRVDLVAQTLHLPADSLVEYELDLVGGSILFVESLRFEERDEGAALLVGLWNPDGDPLLEERLAAGRGLTVDLRRAELGAVRLVLANPTDSAATLRSPWIRRPPFDA